MFGWDYWTYLDQPHWLIKLIIGKYIIDKQKEENQNKTMRRK